MAAVARPRPNHPGGATFVTGTTLNIVSRSHYGRKTRQHDPRRAPRESLRVRFHSTISLMVGCIEVLLSVDLETKRRHDEMMKMASQEKHLFDETRKELDLKPKGLTEEDNVFEARTVSLPYRNGSTSY